MKTSPTQRSIAHLKANGFLVHKTEVWNSFAKRRIDLFGFGDLVGIRGDAPGVLAVQTTSGDNVASRVSKITTDPDVRPKALIWLKAGNRLVVHGWAKRGAAGARKLWTLREIWITLDAADRFVAAAEVHEAA